MGLSLKLSTCLLSPGDSVSKSPLIHFARKWGFARNGLNRVQTWPSSSSLTPRWLSLENFRVLASLDVKVVQTYSKHDPGIDQDNWYYKDVPFNPCWLNLEVFVWSEQLRFDFQLHRAQKIVITQVVAEW